MIGKKVLTICEYGNSRSVGAAYLLKQDWGRDALACGICVTSPETFEMLCNWADTIIVTFAPIEKDINEKFRHKVVVWDVGFDRYFVPPPEELLKQYREYYNSSLKA